MFDYDENDIYERRGYTLLPGNPNAEPYFTGTYSQLTDGTEIPNYAYPDDRFERTEFSDHLVLRTHKGYIPVEDIEKFTDIFKKSKYLQDRTESLKQYDREEATEEEKNQVKKLARTLKNHWKPNKR